MGIRRILGLESDLPSRDERIAAIERAVADEEQCLARERERLRRIESYEDERSCRDAVRTNIRIHRSNIRDLRKGLDETRRRWWQ